MRTAAQAASETFMALNWVLSAASAAASQQLLLLLPEEEGQNLSVVLSSTGAPACMQSIIELSRAGEEGAAQQRWEVRELTRVGA